MVARRWPFFQHDCTHCLWVGTIPHRNRKHVDPCDLYVCLKPDDTAVVARYSNSSVCRMTPAQACEDGISELIVATDVAISLDLLDGDGNPTGRK